MGVVILAFIGTLVVLGTLAVLHRQSHRRSLRQRTRLSDSVRHELPMTPGRIPLAGESGGVATGAGAGQTIDAEQGSPVEGGNVRVGSELRQRFEIGGLDQAGSIPFVPGGSAPALAGAQLGEPEGGPFPGARFVKTADGEAMITRPPFRARATLFNRRHAAYAHLLLGRLPAWVVLCPKTRMDALVAPTPPDGRDAEDWRNWRKRVRWRAVDLLLCDRRTWKPLLAILFDVPQTGRGESSGEAGDSERSRLRMVAGGRDRIVDEVLHAVGLPLVRATGDFASDWAAIEPYVSEAILRSGIVDETFDRELEEFDRLRQLGDTAVNLMAIEGDEGFLLK